MAVGSSRGCERGTSISTLYLPPRAPHPAPYSFALCRQYVDELVLVDDDQLRAALRLLFRGVKLAVEPAGAASTAALRGPLRDKLAGKRVALIVSGANLDAQTFAALLTS